MTDQTAIRRLAILSALSERVTAEIKATKTALGRSVVRGTLTALVDPADPTSEPLGSFTMSKPRQGAPRIVDETPTMSWVVDNFGDTGMVEVRLSEQGRKTAIEAARKGVVPGVETPAPGAPVPSWKPAHGATELVAAMWRAGQVDLDGLMSLVAGR